MFQNPSAKDQILAEGRTEDIVERIDQTGPTLLYLKGHPFPYKGLPTPEAIYAVNIVKRLIIGLAPRWYVPNLFFLFYEIAGRVMNPYFLRETHQQESTKQLYLFTLSFLTTLTLGDQRERETVANVIAHIFEYDGAYRFRLQDLASATSKEKLLRCPQKEIKRLLALNQKRDYAIVSRKFNRAAKLIHWALYIPNVRNAFKKALEATDFEKLQLDKSDRYWISRRTDYTYNG